MRKKIVYLLEFKLLQKKENSSGNRENVWIRMKKKKQGQKSFDVKI